MFKKLLNIKMQSVYNDENKTTLKHNLGILTPVAMLLIVWISVFI